MLVWQPERIHQQYEFESSRKKVLKRTGSPWFSVVFRRNKKRRLSVYFVDPSVQRTSVDLYLERETSFLLNA
jgi:hypothetical protein